MTEEQEEQMRQYCQVQEQIVKILQGEEPEGSDVRKQIHALLSKCGMDLFFVNPKEAFIADHIDFDVGIDGFDDGPSDIPKAIAEGRIPEIRNPWEIQTYFDDRLEEISGAEDVEPILADMRKLKNIYASDKTGDCYPMISNSIGNLLFAIGKPELAIAEYVECMAADSTRYSNFSATIELLNALEAIGRNPSVEEVLRSEILAKNIDKMISCGERYLSGLVECEYARRGECFLSWVKKQKHFAKYDRALVGGGYRKSKLEKYFSVPTLIDYTRAKEYADFVQMVSSDAKALLKLSDDIVAMDSLQESWLRDLAFFDRIRTAVPDEKLVHHYRDSWLWKYQIDVFFADRNFGIVFDTFSAMSDSDFNGGAAGKAQVLKTWKRAIGKARSKYGIELAVLPISVDTGNLQGLIDDCFAGRYSV